jgi:DNA-binding NtrC family response regulator
MKPIHFLLVDDERLFIETLATRLGQRGFQADCAFSGTEALLLLGKKDTIDVVVLDVQMPGTDGFEVVEAIKKRYPLVEVIMLTGHATVPSAIAAMKLGAADYLIKPCDLDYLLDRAETAATRKRERENEIQRIKTMPFISDREREEMIATVLTPE